MKILNVILVLLISISCNNSGGDELPRLLNSVPINANSGVPDYTEFEIHIQALFNDDTVTVIIYAKELF